MGMLVVASRCPSAPGSRRRAPRLGLAALSLGAALLAAACKKETPPAGAAVVPAAAAPPAADPAAAEARSLFDTTCAVCHGATGRGDGPAAAALNPKPRDYSDKAWQASVSDADLRSIIVLGGVGVGKSPTMPGQPQLKNKPAVVDGLVAIIRSFGK
jgi:mono/diheme cytochrome c family protein